MGHYRWLLIFILIVFSSSYGVADNRTLEIRHLLNSRTDFTEKQVENILDLLEKSEIEGLPVEILINRLKEGVARRSTFPVVLNVLTKKINSLQLAKKLLYEYLNMGIRVKDIKYSQQLLAELLERNLLAEEFEAMAKLGLSHNMKMEELLRVCESFVRNKEENFPLAWTMEIVSLAITKGMDSRAIEYISETIQWAMRERTLKIDEIKDIIVEGLNKNRSVIKIKGDLRETAGLDRVSGEKSSDRRKMEKKGEIRDELRRKWNKEKERGMDRQRREGR